MSNLIKSTYYVSLDNTKIIEVLPQKNAKRASVRGKLDEEHAALIEADESFIALKQQIISDAEELAEEQVRAAQEEAAVMKEQAKEEIDRWWEEQRVLDEQHVSAATQVGYDTGYEHAKQQADMSAREEYGEMLGQAKLILEQANEQKQQIILEAEPFLVELSCVIAEKIIGQQLSLTPEWTIQMIKQVLERRREQGTVTLCVAPSAFSYVMDAKDELQLAIDSHAELLIVPDGTVHDHGCVVRTAFGSIDATVDTQLTEIKKVLVQQNIKGGDDVVDH